MPALVIPNTVMVRVLWSLNGREANNVLGMVVAGGFTVTQTVCNSLGNAIASAFNTSGFAADCPAGVTCNGIGMRDIRSADQAEFISVTSPVAGTASSDMLPRNVALVVTLRTALAGRRFRGRVYLGGISENANTGDAECATDVRDDARDFVTAIQTAMSAVGGQLAVMSRPLYNTDTPPALIRPGLSTPVTAAVVRNGVWDSQRRRSGRS